MKKKIDYNSAKKICKLFLTPHLSKFSLTIFLILLTAVFTILNTKVFEILVDSSVSNQFEGLLAKVLIVLVIIIGAYLTSNKKGKTASELGANISRDIKNRVANRLILTDYTALQDLQSGDIIKTVNSDTNQLCSFLSIQLIDIISQSIMALVALVYLVFINYKLALVTFIYTPIGIFFTLSINNKMNELYPEKSKNEASALSKLEQIISSLPIVKSYLMEKDSLKQIESSFSDVCEKEVKISFWRALIQPACSSTSMIPRVLYYLYGGFMVINGELSLGTYVSVFYLISFIISPTVYLPFLLNKINEAAVSANRVSRLLNMRNFENKITYTSSEIPAININELSYSHNNVSIIKNFSLSHSGPGLIVITGESGKGKSTLLNVIGGLLSFNKGSINVLGNVGSMPQESFIFLRSVYENIMMDNLDDSNLINILEISNTTGFINNLENKIETIIGESKTGLSGGQKQRIALARCLIKGSNIILMDEPTSAVDIETENIIVEAIKEISKSKLVIIATHKKALIDVADRRVAL